MVSVTAKIRETLYSPWAIVACLLHAAIASGIWVLMFMFDVDILSGKAWMVLTLVWVVWVGAPIISPKAIKMRWTLTIAAGLLLLAPTISTLYTFIIWGIWGFAP